MRLDDILIEEQLADKSQIDEALEYQERYGGRLESHLFRFGYIDEIGLLKALSRQFNCKSVSLTGREIPENILKLISPEIAFRNIILPFDYDPLKNHICFACENPVSRQLVELLEENIRGRTFEFYIALGPVLKAAIVACYRDCLVKSNQNNDGGYSQTPVKSTAAKIPAKISKNHIRLLIYNEDGYDMDSLEHDLKESNAEVVTAYSIPEFVEQYEKHRTHILILIKSGSTIEISEMVGSLISRGVMLEQIPTLLLTDECMIDSLMHLLNSGIEDVLAFDARSLLALKINRIRLRLETEKKRRLSVIQNLGTHGTLEDMNVIDIIQAMGPSEKTARISITGNGRQLTMYLDRGNIIFAECDECTGPEAVYLAIPWDKGIWSVDPIGPEELPEPNNFQSNESILLEGCRQLDEQNREEQEECDFFSMNNYNNI